jgi:hypothetical protein
MDVNVMRESQLGSPDKKSKVEAAIKKIAV